MELQPEILVVGGTAQSSLELTQWLEKRGCRCHFAHRAKRPAVSFPDSSLILF